MSTLRQIIESLSRQASWDNPALTPKLTADLSTDLMNSADMHLMRHKIAHPAWMPDEQRLKLIIAELNAQGGDDE